MEKDNLNILCAKKGKCWLPQFVFLLRILPSPFFPPISSSYIFLFILPFSYSLDLGSCIFLLFHLSTPDSAYTIPVQHPVAIAEPDK